MPQVLSNGAELYWRSTGEGPPLLMIMGLGYSSGMWHHVEAALAEHFRVIVFDNRGIGRSGPAPAPILIEDMAADAATVLDAAGEASAHVFGLSMGGYIAQELALSRPERVRSLVLGATACLGEHAVSADQEVLDVLVARAHMAPEEGVRAMVPYIYDADTPRERIEQDLAVRLANWPDPETYLGQIEGVNRWTSSTRLDQLACPTLVLHGRNDRLIPMQNGEYLARHIPGAQLRVIDHASHVFTTDQPGVATQAITAFLEASSEGSARS